MVFLIFFVGPALASTDQRSEYEAIRGSEPTFSQIINTFYKNEDLSLASLEKWERRIKTAPYLPSLYVGYDHAIKEGQGISVNDNISITSGLVTMGPDDNNYDYGSDLGRTVRVRAVWKLDEVVFNRNYFALAGEKRDLVRLRFEIGQKIAQIYEQRHLALLQFLQIRSRSVTKADVLYAKYLVLTDELDALSGRVFHERWWRR